MMIKFTESDMIRTCRMLIAFAEAAQRAPESETKLDPPCANLIDKAMQYGVRAVAEKLFIDGDIILNNGSFTLNVFIEPGEDFRVRATLGDYRSLQLYPGTTSTLIPIIIKNEFVYSPLV